eukprot:scaffold47215_cov20-Tisochrysis_lutea.AAC.5
MEGLEKTMHLMVFDEADEMLKAEAFADDSVRLIKNIRKKNPKVDPRAGPLPNSQSNLQDRLVEVSGTSCSACAAPRKTSEILLQASQKLALGKLELARLQHIQVS